MFRSIRWSLQLWHAGILGVALASFGTALYVGISDGEVKRSEAAFKRVDTQIEGAAWAIANASLAPGAFDPWRTGGRDRGGRGGRPGGFGGGPGGGFDGGGGGGGPGGGFGGGPGGGPGGAYGPGFGGAAGGGAQVTDWWSSIPQDALRRIGENEQDQPYFAIWGFEGWSWRVYRASPNAESAGAPTKEDLAAPAPAQWGMGMALSEEDTQPEFRTRGDMREVIVKSPLGAYHVVVGKSLASVYKDVAAMHKDMRILKWKLAGAGGAVMAVGLIGGWLLSLRATKPIRTISETARVISASDLSKRIPMEETSSELGVLAGTLNEMFERLQGSFDRQVRFTADASHELRTPLSVIHSQSELSLSRERNAGEYKQSLEVCLRAAKRMKSLVESLLVLARADAGKLVLNVEKFDLAKAAEECVAMVGPRAAEKHVTVEVELKAVEMEADRTKVMQLITNLLTNAIQYNKEGGKVCLKMGAVTGSGWADGQVEIRVADTGVGISIEDQKKVFERFFRADKARSRDVGGSGLGLAICQSIAEAHGGRITFMSKEGEGTEFVVRMAAKREKESGEEMTNDK